jgi:hypothetical protein
VNARPDTAELAQRFETLRQMNELTAERDQAIAQRDRARLQNKVLQAALEVTARERDEARALGRCA